MNSQARDNGQSRMRIVILNSCSCSFAEWPKFYRKRQEFRMHGEFAWSLFKLSLRPSTRKPLGRLTFGNPSSSQSPQFAFTSALLHRNMSSTRANSGRHAMARTKPLQPVHCSRPCFPGASMSSFSTRPDIVCCGLMHGP